VWIIGDENIFWCNTFTANIIQYIPNPYFVIESDTGDTNLLVYMIIYK
jgi:hypothetical protein